jgi:phosphoglycerate dehydrogenase-like enzyme
VVKQHVPLLAIPEGLTMVECDALADWRGSRHFSERERAALAYTDSMTSDIRVPDGVFNELKKHFNERQIVELTVLIGTYNMHTRVFQALQIDPEPHHTRAIGARELAAAPRLKTVQKYGVGLRHIDVAACAARNIPVLTLRRRANVACAELAIAFMLMLSRRVQELQGRISAEQLAAIGYPYRPFDRRHTANSNWGRVPGLRILYGGTVGIVGLGEIGREFALRASAFGLRILYSQRTRLPEAEEQELQASYRPLAQLLAESDWVVPLVPGDSGTRHLIDGAGLARMKPGACLVNVARADVVERGALIAALRSGRLAGFALDPLYEEPGRADDELAQFPNVILTPHIAAQPRTNALDDLRDMIERLGRASAS